VGFMDLLLRKRQMTAFANKLLCLVRVHGSFAFRKAEYEQLAHHHPPVQVKGVLRT
jgi:hypothetical protein